MFSVLIVTGGKAECPICGKIITYGTCLNVYLDAMPDLSPDSPGGSADKIKKIRRENSELKNTITGYRKQILAKEIDINDLQAERLKLE